MEEILLKLGFNSLVLRFNEEKITPDLVCKLFKFELLSLGLGSPSDIMKLRLECLKYESLVSMRVSDFKIRYEIGEEVLENLMELGFAVSDMSKLLSVSERTIFRRMTQYGLRSQCYTDISDDTLDECLGDVLVQFPRCGEKMIRQLLVTKGIKVNRKL